MQVILNGEKKDIQEETTVEQLLKEHNLKPELIVVQINNEIIARDKYKEHVFQVADQVELIKFMAGG